MADAIFNEIKVLKKDIYKKIIELFVSAGWTNVSSNPATDYVVLNSKGESGDKDLFIQLRPFTTVEATNSVELTDYNVIGYRLIEGYVAGVDGASGTFTRTTEPWGTLYVIPTATVMNKEVELTCLYHVNKNRLVLAIESPSTFTFGAILHYVGLPDAIYTSESGSKGFVVASSAYPKANLTLAISNASDGLPSDAVSSTRTTYATLAPRNPNSAGLFTLSEILYGDTTEGMRGKLTGIYQMPNGNVNNGDIIVIGSKEFRVVVTQTVSNQNSFTSSTFVIQMV